MNKVVLMGRLTRDPEVRYKDETAIAKFSIAVNRWGKDAIADYFDCVAFGKLAELVERYVTKGVKIALVGRIQNNNYTNREGRKVYGIQIVADELEFAESKNTQRTEQPQRTEQAEQPQSGFMSIPDNVPDEELPFN